MNTETRRKAEVAIGMGVLFGVLVGALVAPGESEAKPKGKGKAVTFTAYNDCENVLTVPCVTFDEGEWRKVTSYKPYRSTDIKKPLPFRGKWLVVKVAMG